MNEVKKNHRTRDHQLVRNASKKKCLSKKKELKIKQNSVSVFHRSFGTPTSFSGNFYKLFCWNGNQNVRSLDIYDR